MDTGGGQGYGSLRNETGAGIFRQKTERLIMMQVDPRNLEAEAPRHAISDESVLSYVVIGCFVVAILGILGALGRGDANGGVSLLASAAALGVIAYVYCHKN
jgi:hypothetical protein